MSKLLIIIFTFSFFSFQNEKSSVKEFFDKPSNSFDSTNFHSITTNKYIDSINFVAYWKNFRQAVLNSNLNEISNQTKFPVLARGSLDSDPEIEYSKRQFPRVFNFFLNQWAGDEIGRTEFDIIKSIEVPKEKVIHGQIRIGDMVFFLIDKKWKLNFLYLNYETIDSIKSTK